jgi:hypothetical protein
MPTVLLPGKCQENGILYACSFDPVRGVASSMCDIGGAIMIFHQKKWWCCSSAGRLSRTSFIGRSVFDQFNIPREVERAAIQIRRASPFSLCSFPDLPI